MAAKIKGARMQVGLFLLPRLTVGFAYLHRAVAGNRLTYIGFQVAISFKPISI
jgi:hypothetical protein